MLTQKTEPSDYRPFSDFNRAVFVWVFLTVVEDTKHFQKEFLLQFFAPQKNE